MISIAQLADEFAAFDSSLNLRHVNLVGYSTGGTIAYITMSCVKYAQVRAVLLDPLGLLICQAFLHLYWLCMGSWIVF